MREYRIKVYDDDGKVISRVRYNRDLDLWDGRNFSNGGIGRHKGITKLGDGRYVIIYGNDLIGVEEYGKVVSNEIALQEIMKAQRLDLLNTKKYHSLKDLYNRINKDGEGFIKEWNENG